VQVSRAGGSGTHDEFTTELSLGASGEGASLLVAHMDPLDAPVAPDSIGHWVEAIAHDAIDPLDAGTREGIDQHIGNSSRHYLIPPLFKVGVLSSSIPSRWAC
jgi:hypothetical protein